MRVDKVKKNQKERKRNFCNKVKGERVEKEKESIQKMENERNKIF